MLEVLEKGRLVDEKVLLWLLNFFSKQVVVLSHHSAILITETSRKRSNGSNTIGISVGICMRILDG
jgi:hypothetical protein